MGEGRTEGAGVMLQIAALALASAMGNADRGQAIYAVHCATCHGLNLQGSQNAPTLLISSAAIVDFELRTGRMPAEGPPQQQYDHRPFFTRGEIGDLEAFIASRSSGDKMLPDARSPQHPAHSELITGREVFEENCEQCHAATGRGDAATGFHDVAPELTNAGPQTIADAVRSGPDVMPPFGTGAIDGRHMSDLIAYVRYLQRADYNPGGMQLANYGPVPEGFMAWAALAVLILLCRRIGEP